MKIAIDISRTMSGGGKSHIMGIISEAEPYKFNISEIHVFGRESILNQLNDVDKPWLIKHKHPLLEKTLIHQIYWQFFLMPKIIKKLGCDVLLSTDAGTLSVCNPSVVMSRDMLSFERSEIGRYPKFSKLWLRLWVLRYVQIRSLKKASGALFLTKYAADTIQQWSGKISNYRIIPHGVGRHFRINKRKEVFKNDEKQTLECVYVSNAAMYKHQWNVARAVKQLRDEENIDLKITFIGGGVGPAQDLLVKTLKEIDPHSNFTFQDKFISNEELPNRVLNYDFFIFASSCENMPNTLVEGMALGMPIVCSDKGPMPEVLEDGGVYFNPEDIHSIKVAMKEIILNEEKRKFMAERAYQISQKYSWKRCSEETFQFLIDITKKHI